MGIELVPKALVMLGGDGVVTVMLAVAVLPAPPSLEVTAPVTLAFMPALTPVTLTEKVQEALAASTAPERLWPGPAGGGVIVAPPHDPVRPFGVETAMPAGKLSVNPTPV